MIGLVDPENAASIRVLEKIGMKHVGTMEYLGTTVVRYVADAPR
jgi:RimJ/RimL family protein N-acetyltransferase